MARGPLSEETKKQRALAQAAEVLELLGGTEEEVRSIESVQIDLPTEQVIDKIREAVSVLIYFSTGGSRFKELPCKYCEKIFAYRWELDSIQYCSLQCVRDALKQIGIKWDPYRPQNQRWGRTAPAVIPPTALEILKDQMIDFLKDHSADTVA